jgi:PAS domain S-box-containing protein
VLSSERDTEEELRQLAANMQSALDVSEIRYRLLTETAFDGIVVSEDGVIYEANNGCGEMFGYSRDELNGKPLEDLLADESGVEMRQRIHDRMSGKYDIVGRHRDGRKMFIEATDKTYKIDGRSQRITALRDLTEKHELDHQYRQAQKMEAVGRLAGGVAHDFNNLLTVISSYASLLIEETAPSSAMRGDLLEILGAAESAATLTRQLLAFSRQQVLAPRVLDINESVRRAESMLQRVIGEDVELSTALDEHAGCVLADFGQIEQVIMNLALNARDAMPSGGVLTISTKALELRDEHRIEHPGATPGQFVTLAVSDSGMGMDAATKARIFEPFFTTKELGKGTGLGLATVYGIVTQSAGFIEVESAAGKGTTFKILFPRVDDTPEPIKAPIVPLDDAGTETILLVEDVDGVRAIERRVLQRKGYSILDAADAASAIRVVENHPEHIALLLTDVVLPGMGGRELSEIIKRARPHIKVLFTSGYTNDAVMLQGIVEQGVEFMQKPFTPDTLTRRVREVLDSANAGSATAQPPDA